jgi:hypothetical protein
MQSHKKQLRHDMSEWKVRFGGEIIPNKAELTLKQNEFLKRICAENNITSQDDLGLMLVEMAMKVISFNNKQIMTEKFKVKLAKIHNTVIVQMAKNNSITDDRWFERELINSKWISINANTSMFIADEYLTEHQKEVDDHNQKIRIVDGKDLGRYFNRSARAERRRVSH